jgi:ribosome-binding protein aMBF1 (putative translation factor)
MTNRKRTDFKAYHNKMLKNKDYKKSYDDLEVEFSIIEAMLKAQKKSGLSQQEIADKMGTSKTAISRLFNGKQLPSWQTIHKFADAIGAKPEVKFVL